MTKFNRQNFIFVILILAIVYLGGIINRQNETKTPDSERPALTAQAIKVVERPAVSLIADLDTMSIYFYENEVLKKEYKILSKGDSSSWWRTPTGKFKIGLKSENFWSAAYLVNLPWALQFYEDFYIHGAPRDKKGNIAENAFIGGGLRLSDSDAKALYESAGSGVPIFIREYDLAIIKERIGEKNEFVPENLQTIFEKNKFTLPVNPDKVYVKKDFGSPTVMLGESGEYGKYVNHAGVDFAPISSADRAGLEVKAAGYGRIALIQPNDGSDNGLGNALILEHKLYRNETEEIIYSLYGHLKSFSRNFKIGDEIQKGELIGVMGATGFGCENFWRRGENGCENQNSPDVYLHFEIKKSPASDYYEFTPNEPARFGYINPIEFILENR
jgi:murein DD-endopeptidase MepM/ murein hydrolase activator NlpD